MLCLTIITFLFYSLNVTGVKIKNFVLVDGSCIQTEPIDLAFWFPYCIAVIIFYSKPDIGQWILLSLYLLGIVVLSVNTFKYTLFPNERKIKGYNKCFEKTHHIFKPSDKRLIPDTFHLTLYILLYINLVSMILFIK
ncbi:MAG: hypothetical protein FWG98_14315 [Candidatus Cloacimonetes bacterium]|nr:hypothetical protein [Candidatus Cloacimonadota bacterium]